MGQGIMKGKDKNTFLYVGFFLFIMLILNACACVISPHPIDYQLLDTSGKYRLAVKKDINSYEVLMDKGSVFYISFGRVDNNRYFDMEIDLYTLQKYNVLKIHSLEFEFEGMKKNVNVNKTINLNIDHSFRKFLFIVEDHGELNVMAYNTLIQYFDCNIKIDLHKILNKNDEDIGKKMDLTLRVNYSFDKGEVVTQENKYLVSIFKTRRNDRIF